MFLRIYVGIVAVVAVMLAVAGFALQRIDQPLLRAAQQSLALAARIIVPEIQDASHDPTALEEQRRRLEERLGVPVSVLPFSDARVPLDVRDRLRETPVFVESCADPRIFGRIDDGERVLAVGPVPIGPLLSATPAGVFLAALAIIAGIGAASLVRPLERQLQEMSRAAVAFGRGDLDARAGVRRSNEIGTLATAFNEMAERITALIRGREELLHAVSHEFRAPLARLRFAAEMSAGEVTAEDRARLLARMLDDLGELTSLVEELLASLRLESDAASLAHVDLHELLVRSAVGLETLRPDVVVETAPIGGDLLCACNERLVERALRNLIGNALRHARARVRLECHPSEEWIDLVIDDDGPGVPPEDRERIFDPFVRLDPARVRAPGLGGTGLGLAIVRRIARDHLGSVHVEDAASLGGARFVLRVPRAGRRTNPSDDHTRRSGGPPSLGALESSPEQRRGI